MAAHGNTVHGNLLALVLSFTLIGLSYFISLTIKKKDVFLARKVLHISVCNWAFIYIYVFEDKFLLPLLGLLFMAIVNFIIEFSNKTKSVSETTTKSKVEASTKVKLTDRNLGTIEYPLVMALILVFIKLYTVYYSDYFTSNFTQSLSILDNTSSTGIISEFVLLNAFICALLGMGYGDGLSAVFGYYFSKKILPYQLPFRLSYNKNKTILGSLVMFISVFIVVQLVMKCSVLISMFVALISTVLEAYTPFKLDNITVPLGIFFSVILLC